jgi:hypothetical protein
MSAPDERTQVRQITSKRNEEAPQWPHKPAFARLRQAGGTKRRKTVSADWMLIQTEKAATKANENKDDRLGRRRGVATLISCHRLGFRVVYF